MNRTYTVYKGMDVSGNVVYIGTTIQKPKDRFRWHKHNGKDLNFSVLYEFDNEHDMLDKEYELIKLHNPALNKIKHRKQNLNKKLTQVELDARKGDPCWCQDCLKRRVNNGYTHCMWCGK